MLSSLLASKLAMATAAGAVGLSGAATAAYTGNLPEQAQQVAHDTIKAPPPHAKKNKQAKEAGKPTATPVGPDATGAAAFGLCTAFDKERIHGKAAEKSVAFRNLATAAGGADKIGTYCASVPQPNATASQAPKTPGASSGRATGKPENRPTGKQTSPTATPTAAP